MIACKLIIPMYHFISFNTKNPSLKNKKTVARPIDLLQFFYMRHRGLEPRTT